MATVITNIEQPELFFGLVGAIGADLDPVINSFRVYLEAQKYHVISIKVTDTYKLLDGVITPKPPLTREPLRDRYRTYISYGNKLRSYFKDDSVLAALSIAQIIRRRAQRLRQSKETPSQKTAYIIHQFKRKEEIDLLRTIYGRLFLQVSVYSRRGARVDYLARKFADGENSADINRFRSDAESLVQQDENETAVEHGQRVGKVFHDADFIVNSDVIQPSIPEQVFRFGELLFGSNSISPTKIEYGMFMAKAAALRTLDLSRQVGAAIFSPTTEIISLGSNEVPKASGGTYWSDDQYDDREWMRNYDSNDKRKKEILLELFATTGSTLEPKKWLQKKSVEDSQFMDALEYGRIVHAEMSAISDAARTGRSVRDSILYSTTFPCHMCAKHIVAAGVSKVIFLEPYPKSLASELHSDSLDIEGTDRGTYSKFPSVRFEHFFGVTPRRYRELFERGKRKDKNGIFISIIGRFLPYLKG